MKVTLDINKLLTQNLKEKNQKKNIFDFPKKKY